MVCPVSIIVSAAERAGCTLIFSENLSDGQTYHEILVRNPFNKCCRVPIGGCYCTNPIERKTLNWAFTRRGGFVNFY
jgi:hypothetical protein